MYKEFTLKNLLKPSEMTFSDASYSDGVFTHNPSGVAMVNQSLATPILGHKYYGRVLQKAPAGYTYGDARFEYYAEDVGGTGLLVFGFMEPTNDEWKMMSSIQELTGEPSSKSWILRSFTVSGSTAAYRKQPMIIDLTEAFGAGNEPTKEWLDTNIPYFEGTYSGLLEIGTIFRDYSKMIKGTKELKRIYKGRKLVWGTEDT